MPSPRRDDLIYPELSYQIMGSAFDEYNELGFGLHEKHYQRSFAIALKNQSIQFKEQVYYPLKFQGELVGKLFLDFLIEEKVIVELKKDERFSKQHIDQVNGYLKAANIKLALLINFTRSKVDSMRLLNIK